MCHSRLFAAAILTLGCLHAQVAAIAPAQPKWGETLRVTYDPSAPGAQLRQAPAWASLTIYFEDQSSRSVAGTMSNTDDHRLRFETTVPEGACLIEIAFVTPHDYDAAAGATVVIARPDGKVARNAYDHLMWKHTGDADRYFQQEIALYPDNWAAYRHRWFLSTGGKEKEIATIREDLAKMDSQAQGAQTGVEWLYAMSYADWRLGNTEKAEADVRRMVEASPQSPLTSDALNYYVFRSTGGAKERARKLERLLASTHPASPYAGFALITLAADPDFPLEAAQRVAREQLGREPWNVSPYLAVAKASLIHQQDYPQAVEGLRKALGILLDGQYRVRLDPAGTLTRSRLAEAYRLLGEIQLAQSDASGALASVKAAESFERDTNTAGRLLESRIWSAIGDWPRAESALLEAWRRDPVGTEEPLRQVFAKIRASADGFPAFLEANRTAAAAQEKKKPYPFDVVSLDGKPWSLAELKGKTVALNFWFVGCLPCREEIPVLNQLVEQYKDVVFLGFALDDSDQLRDFLKKYPFRYEIVPNAQKIADAFRVPSYPAHVLINPAGEIALDNTDSVDSLKAALARR
jgi:thiol-disulfide isomerase/thioredoxin